MLALFTLTSFVSALLLFSVQPMFAKMLLPLLGGTPAVWNTCMVFFQSVLLAGYVYVHGMTRWLGPRRQAMMHVPLMLLGGLSLPIAVARGWTPPTSANPFLWLLLLLAASVGLPVFFISCTAPMIQIWFSRTRHPEARDPYFLYSASNLGSMVALVGYPALVEPLARVPAQAAAWSWGCLGLAVLTVGAAVLLHRRPAGPEASTRESGAGETLTRGRRLRWTVLAAVPSALLLAVTTMITTNIAPVPLLWIIPLALYLLSFILVFARRSFLPHRWMTGLQPFLVLPVALQMYLLDEWSSMILAPLHLILFFVTAMVCHGELARDRPGAGRLTEFYLYLSVGGVVGGLFVALLAPMLFTGVAEYPILLVASLLLCAWGGPAEGRPRDWRRDLGWPLGLGLAAFGLIYLLRHSGVYLLIRWSRWAVLGALAATLLAWRGRMTRLAAGTAVLLAVGAVTFSGPYQVVHRERNFFGLLWVERDPFGGFNVLTHGTTIHGAQNTDPAFRREPQTYFSRYGPLGQIFLALGPRLTGGRIAVAGLGAGVIAAYGQAGQTYTYYEIDPAVERLARTPAYFTYLADTPAEVKVVIGDARLRMQEAPDGAYSLIVVDVFSSDAIPTHLLTREAFDLYFRKLAPGGVLAINITNRYLLLEPVVDAVAREAGLVCMINEDRYAGPPPPGIMRMNSTWVVLARQQADIGALPFYPRWRVSTGGKDRRVWTDDYSNILSILRS